MAKMCAPSSDSDWEAESDARTLISAETIRSDAARFKRAKTALGKVQKQAKEAQKRSALEATIAKKLKTIDKED
jgi:hypothetical protein